MLPVGIVIFDARRRCVYANPAAADLTGLSLDNLVGCDLPAAFAPQDRAAIVEHMAAALSGTPAGGSATIRRPDGEEREVEYKLHLLEDARPLVTALLKDVTDARRAARKAEALAQIASRVAFADSLEGTLDKLAQNVTRATGTVASGVCLVDEQGEFQVFGSYGIPKDPEAEARWREASQRGAKLPNLESFREQRPLIHLDARRKLLGDPAYEPIHYLLESAAWDAVVSVPLIYRRRSIGVLNVFYPAGKNPGETEIEFLTTIADQAAVAAENARLFDEARSRAVFEERHRLARELHDSVSQALYGIALGARTARTLLDRDPPKAVEPLDYVLSLAEAGLAEMRALIFELRPETLETEGLVAALTRQIDSARARHGVDVHAEWCGEPDFPYEIKETVYRIAQEAINNIIKHARARHANLRLMCSDDEILLEIRDDGIGFESDGTTPGHLGLRSMHERAARVGGTLLVQSAPSQGTAILARIPRNGEK
jgi:PAS domain S-box-containing protein